MNAIFLLMLVSGCTMSAAQDIPQVIFAEAGTVDDYASTVLLAAMHNEGIINFLGDIVQNGDSVLPASMEVAEKVHELANITEVPVLLSQTKMYNPFPWLYRGDSQHIIELPGYQAIPCETCTNVSNPMDYPNGEDFLKEVLEDAEDGSITYALTAGMGNIADVLRENPELESKVKEILWMGGAINVPGNMEKDQFTYTIWNDKAEWNVYSAPFDAAYIFENTSIPIYMFPLDIADQVPVKGPFIDTLGAVVNESESSTIDQLMYTMYNEIAMPQPKYRLWNTVVAAYLSPALQKYYAEPEDMEVTIVTDFENQGWTAKKGDVDTGNFRDTKVFLSFKSDEDKAEWTKKIANTEVV